MEQNSVSGISNFLGSFILVIRVTFAFFALLSKKESTIFTISFSQNIIGVMLS